VGIPTSQNPDTPKGLKSRLSVRIHRIPAELPHSTELELRKLRQTRMDYGRAFVLELLRGLPTSREVLRPSKPCLSLYSTKIEFGCPLGVGGGKPHFLHTFCQGKQCGIYRRSNAVFWPKIGRVRSTCQAGRPCNLVGWPSFLLHHLWALDTLSTASSGHVDKTVFQNAPTHGRPAKVMSLAGHTLARLSSCFVPCHFLVSYFL
jgi:hypothetical protein